MQLPRWWARAGRITVNPLARRVAWWLPGMGLLTHRGRRSGKEYRTPLLVFTRPGAWVVPLAYGTHTDWVRNVHAAGQATLRTRRKVLTVQPHLVHHRAHPDLAAPTRAVWAVVGVRDFLEFTPVAGALADLN